MLYNKFNLISLKNKYYSYNISKIYFSFCVAILLQTILCFPKIYNTCPSWVMIILIYWIMISPYQVSVGTGFFVGLILDIVLGSIIGIHALSFSIISYLLICKIHFFRYTSVWVQSCIVGLFSVINYSIVLLVMYFFIKITYSPKMLWNCILDGSIWSTTIFIMRKIYNIKNNNI